MKQTLFIIVLFSLLLAACGSTASVTDAPEKVIEAYLAAIVAGDSAQAVALSCAAWEASASDDSTAFEGVEVSLESPVCQVSARNGAEATVTCTGEFVFSYAGGETQTIGLDVRTYIAAQEDGQWLMCGYK